jgi:hypothetical protein
VLARRSSPHQARQPGAAHNPALRIGRRCHAPNAMDNFCFDVTLGYRRLERPRRAEVGS